MSRAKPERLKFLTRPEVRTLLDGPRNAGRERDYYLLSAMYYLALRCADVVALRAEHLTIDDGAILVPSAKRKAKKSHDVDSMTGRPLLRVPLLHGFNVLRAMKDWAVAHGAPWVFHSRQNPEKPLSTRQVSNTFHLWSRVAGFDKRISPHSLRHSAGTHVYEAVGEELVLIRDFMRHTDIKVTSIYLHTTPTKVEQARMKMRQQRGTE